MWIKNLNMICLVTDTSSGRSWWWGCQANCYRSDE